MPNNALARITPDVAVAPKRPRRRAIVIATVQVWNPAQSARLRLATEQGKRLRATFEGGTLVIREAE